MILTIQTCSNIGVSPRAQENVSLFLSTVSVYRTEISFLILKKTNKTNQNYNLIWTKKTVIGKLFLNLLDLKSFFLWNSCRTGTIFSCVLSPLRTVAILNPNVGDSYWSYTSKMRDSYRHATPWRLVISRRKANNHSGGYIHHPFPLFFVCIQSPSYPTSLFFCCRLLFSRFSFLSSRWTREIGDYCVPNVCCHVVLISFYIFFWIPPIVLFLSPRQNNNQLLFIPPKNN